MGIINVTPDSFYDGGKTTHKDSILQQTEKMLTEGATFLDVGGYSSRPNAIDISEEEEISRVVPAIKSILDEFPETLISIDTFRSQVAKKAVETGACMVNDISGGTLDEAMFTTVAKMHVPYILMHMRGTPQTMTQQTGYNDVTIEVIRFFSEQIAKARKAGINDIVIDPGFGFAKTKEQCFELLQKLTLLKQLDVPILAGLSRKSMIYKTLNISAKEALNGTTVLNTLALQKETSILRVHDVKEAMECIKLTEMLTPYL
ncbi:dihydropteroate synthase [Marixanthomonas ophiurae]|uniref:dihydropteroate synthase n=2 Tax=Marixanthomonas ophiurae TaxID=387659 RepID=A0A3E1QCQ1_9FLAO|nr:dihydropteroate synthase [Marixanthomonas ophiurae]RFN59930.1 dihydropteroate synthase [Marixanthomonas ophiurae]